MVWAIACSLAAIAGVASADSKCTMARAADWTVRLERGLVIVDGAINGQKVAVMVDTGGTTMILRSATDRLGLVRHEAPGYRAFGVGGETYVEATNVEEFKLGAMTRRNWRVMVAGEYSFGAAADFILGEDFLEQLDVEFDLPHNALRLYQVKDCEGVVLSYWSPQASQVDFEPSYDTGGLIAVPVQINGRRLQAVLDSGASSSTLDKPVAEQVGIRTDSPGVTPAGKLRGLGGKPIDAWFGPLQSFTIGNETISDTTIRFGDLWKDATYTPIGSHLPRKVEFTPALMLGLDFLRSHRVLVAHSQRKMYFSYEGGPVFQPRPVTSQGGKPQSSDRPGKTEPQAN
jgi:predicted aspartyl protease